MPEHKTGSPERSECFITAAVAGLLALVVLLLYARGLAYPLLIGDDHYNLDYNTFLHPVTRKSFTEIWSQIYLSLYIPVTLSLWAVLQWLGEQYSLIPRAVYFHSANLLVHWANSVLVYLLLVDLLEQSARSEERTRLRYAAGFGALLFCVHPLQVKDVAWITGMKDLLSTFFALLCLRGIVRARATVTLGAQGLVLGFGSWRAYFAASLCFALSLLSKPNTVVLPGLALIVLAAARQDWRKALPPVLPWLAGAAFLSIRMVGVQLPDTIPPVWLRPFGALDNINYYVAKLFFPYPLTFEVTHHVLVRSETLSFWLGTIVTLLVLGVFVKYRPRDPLILLGLLFAAVALLPILGFVPYGHQNFSDVSPHYMYLPLVGVALTVAALAVRIRKKALLWVAAAPLALFAVLAFARVPDYQSDDQLLGPVLSHDPDNLFAHANLAVSLTRRKNYPLAIAEAFRALQLKPEGFEEWQRVAQAVLLAGAPERAIAFYRVVVARFPGDPRLRFELGHLLVLGGHVKEGAELLAATVRESPAFAKVSSDIAYTVLVESPDATVYQPALMQAAHLAPEVDELKDLLLLARPL